MLQNSSKKEKYLINSFKWKKEVKGKKKKKRNKQSKSQQFVPLGCVAFTTESTYKQGSQQRKIKKSKTHQYELKKRKKKGKKKFSM